MRVALLHTQEAAGPPVDPVLEQLGEALVAQGHHTLPLAVDTDIEPVVTMLRGQRPDLVFNLAESFRGKSALESNVAALLNLMGLRYTGSSPAGLLVAGDKTLTKKVLSFHGIRTPEFATLYRGAVDWAGDIQFPVIVKPPQEDASLGISTKSVVYDLRGLFEMIHELQATYQQPALVERFIEGREFYVGVLGNVNARALPVVELDFSSFPVDRPRVASWDAKWLDAPGEAGAEFAGTTSIFPVDLPSELAQRMQTVAVEAFQALRLRDYARVDLRVSESEEVFVIEVNPNCYLERSADFASAALHEGISYEDLISTIISLASARYSR
ncbi:MAG: ATP-grasp domain-containing protein [Gemmatimonadaceae bacterium]